MDVERPTTEQQLLAHAEKQTEALQSLRGIALVWTAMAAAGLVVWLLVVLLS